ncbi:hypothetical protein ACFYPN_15970 [Streptomyces sp. NPDC005576]|uniref:hypothetical protein n=1 Tax=Streptomyces sp. NPDC005576 TaxID=3364726 RepID=UPI003692525B
MTTPNPYITAAAPRPRMFTRPWQRWAWAVVPLISMFVLAFLPFLVAAIRGVVAWPITIAYMAASGTVAAFAVIQPDVNGWFAAGVWLLMLTAVVHVILLDKINGSK